MTLIKREDAIDELRHLIPYKKYHRGEWVYLLDKREVFKALNALPSADGEKKKAELKENGDWDCPDVYCDGCDHHRSVEWCSLAIPNHEEKIDETYKMANEAFFEGFDAAEKRYRFLIEYVEELDKKLAETEWIPCSKRLPNVGEDVLFCDSEWTEEGWLMADGDWWQLRWSTVVPKKEVTAWMPLPKPYREDGEA